MQASNISKEQIHKISKILEEFLKIQPLEKWYSAKFPDEVLPAFCAENLQFNTNDSDFEKNIKLKESLKNCFDLKNPGCEKNEKLEDWIIHNWGGIQGKTSNTMREKILNDITSAKEALNPIKLSDGISSRSKVLSFFNPEKYAICDSRVIFSLNWLLLFTKPNDCFYAFTELASSNATIKNFNISFLIEIFNIKQETVYKKYQDFLNILNQLTSELSTTQKDWKLYKTEMLLFSIAPNKDFGIPFIIKELFSGINNKNRFCFETVMEKLEKVKPDGKN